jgi:hypothetical protein
LLSFDVEFDFDFDFDFRIAALLGLAVAVVASLHDVAVGIDVSVKHVVAHASYHSYQMDFVPSVVVVVENFLVAGVAGLNAAVEIEFD